MRLSAPPAIAACRATHSRPTLPEAEAADPAEDPRLVTLGDAGAFEKRDSKTDLKVELHQRLLDLINLSALDQMSREQIQAEVGDIVVEELGKQNHAVNQAERKQLVADILDELLVTRAVKADHCQIVNVATETAGNIPKVIGNRGVDVN